MDNMGPLSSIRIIDFTHVFQGPVATQILADFGADVIKIEREGMGDWSRGYGPYQEGMSLVYAGLNRNKRSLIVNAQTAAGQDILMRLLINADVVVHNFRPGVDKKLGMDYETLKKINPRIIHAHSSGWGDKGPYVERARKGHADMAAANGGLFKRTDEQGIPLPPGISVDYPAGLLLAQAIILALFERERSGMGQEVSTDLLSAAVHARIWESGQTLNPDNQEHSDQDLGATDASIRHSWRTRDGFIEISPVFSPDALRDISIALGLGDLSQDPRFKTASDRLRNQQELEKIFERRLCEKTTAEWLQILEPAGVLCSEIKTYEEALQDPQVEANEMVVEMRHQRTGTLRLLGTPIRMSRTPSSLRTPPAYPGEHTDSILKELAYTEDVITQLHLEKVVF